MDKQLLGVLKKAQDLEVINSGSILVFEDILHECENKIKAKMDEIQRLRGQVEQLTFVRAMMYSSVSKYIRMQEKHDKDTEEALERKGGADTPDEEKTSKGTAKSLPEGVVEVKTKKTKPKK